jgi:hypothetical protein
MGATRAAVARMESRKAMPPTRTLARFAKASQDQLRAGKTRSIGDQVDRGRLLRGRYGARLLQPHGVHHARRVVTVVAAETKQRLRRAEWPVSFMRGAAAGQALSHASTPAPRASLWTAPRPPKFFSMRGALPSAPRRTVCSSFPHDRRDCEPTGNFRQLRKPDLTCESYGMYPLQTRFPAIIWQPGAGAVTGAGGAPVSVAAASTGAAAKAPAAATGAATAAPIGAPPG